MWDGRSTQRRIRGNREPAFSLVFQGSNGHHKVHKQDGATPARRDNAKVFPREVWLPESEFDARRAANQKLWHVALNVVGYA